MSQNLSSVAVVIGALTFKYDTKIDSTVYENQIDTLSNIIDQIKFLDHLTKGQVQIFAENPEYALSAKMLTAGRWKLEILLAGNKRSIEFQLYVNTAHIAVCVKYPLPLNVLNLYFIITRFGAFEI